MMTIPKQAWPVVEEIRKHVPRPTEMPTPKWNGFTSQLGWKDDHGNGHRCPVGLLPYVLAAQPCDTHDFNSDCPFSIFQARAFWIWWDVQIYAEKAVAEVWEGSGWQELRRMG